jgi:hypothetical protein
MSVALSIAFTGLCALVGGGDGKPGEVLLLDAKGVGAVRGVSLPEHSPTLVVSMNDLANPESSRPTRVVAGRPGASGRVDQLGIWDLTGFEVRIRAQGDEPKGLQLFQPSKGETSWPKAPRSANDAAAWRDLRFVPSMTTLVGDGRIDPAVLGNGSLSPGALPRSLAARIYLDAGLLEGALPSQEAYREELFEFRGGVAERPVRQALTDTVQWSLKTEAAAVVIDLVPTTGGETKRLLFAPSEAPHRLFVSNLPAENSVHSSSHAMSGEDMSGLHFGAYYALLMEPPTQMPLPTVASAGDSRKGASAVRPVPCHLAMFSRP